MSYILVEYRCTRCGEVFESLETRSSVPARCPHPASSACAGTGERVISAVAFRRKYGEVTRGTSVRPDHALDTRPLAEGVPLHEWRKASRAKRRDVIRRYGP